MIGTLLEQKVFYKEVFIDLVVERRFLSLVYYMRREKKDRMTIGLALGIKDGK